MEQYTILRALNMTTGAYLIPEVIDNAIRDYGAKEPVLYNAVTHVPWATPTYFIRKRTSVPTASWSTDGASLPAASDQGFGKVSKTVKYIYTHGEVTGPEIAAARSEFDVLAMDIEIHTRELVRKLSTDLATATGASDSIQGILNQIDTDASMNAGGGVLDASAAALTLAKIDEAIDLAQGDVDLIVTSRQVRRKINSLLQAQQRFNDTTEVAAGFRVPTYDGLPIVTDLGWETSGDLLLIRRADAKLLVHQDLTFEQMAKVKDATEYFIKAYMGFALEGRPVHLKNFTS